MEVKIKKMDLLGGLQKVLKMTEGGLGDGANGILLEEKGDELSLSAGNGRCSAKYVVPVVGGMDGEAFVDGKLLTSYVSSFRDGDVAMKADGNQMSLKCAGRQVRLSLLEKKFSFSQVKFSPLVSFRISGMILYNIINDVAFSAAKNSENIMINSIECTVSDNEFTMTALDGHRIAWRKAKIKPTGVDAKCIIEASVLVRAASLLPIDKEIYFEISESKFRLSVDTLIMVGATVAGEYLKVGQILQPSQSCTTRLVIDKKKLESIVSACLLASAEGEKRYPMILEIGNTARISSKGNLSEVIEEVACQISGKQNTRIGFNPVYVRDCLRKYPADEVEIELYGSRLPARFILDGYVIVILPVNIQQLP